MIFINYVEELFLKTVLAFVYGEGNFPQLRSIYNCVKAFEGKSETSKKFLKQFDSRPDEALLKDVYNRYKELSNYGFGYANEQLTEELLDYLTEHNPKLTREFLIRKTQQSILEIKAAEEKGE